MKEREPGFLYGLNAADFLKIGLAFMLSLAGFYLIWRMLFGPPLFQPTAIQAQLKALQTKQQPENSADQQKRTAPGEIDHTPGEVSVGIAPSGSKHR